MSLSNNHSDNLQNHLQEQQLEVDSLDVEIIRLLQQDGRMAYSLISRTLNISEATIRYRIKRLIEEKIISVTAYINYEKLKVSSIACIELEVEPDFFLEAIAELVEMTAVSFLAVVTGRTNVTLEYVYESNDDLIDFINYLKRLKQVKQVDSRIMLRVYKTQYPVHLKQS